MSNNDVLRQKIDDAKRRLAMPSLMRRLGHDEKHINKTAYCPFHSDEHKSFSVFHSKNGKGWQWKCFAGCGEGDEIAFLEKHFGSSTREVITLYLNMAGFPPSRPVGSHECPASREYPKSRESLVLPESHGSPEPPEPPEPPESPVSPVSDGQALEEELEDLVARNGCTCAADNPERKRFKLARDVIGVEKRRGCELAPAVVIGLTKEWYRLSKPFLPTAETQDDHVAKFLRELIKVRWPTGERDTLTKALEYVSTLAVFELPDIPGVPDAPENWRRILALHRELSRLSANKRKTYFLSCRDAARSVPGLPHQKAYDITLALERLGAIKIVRAGVARPNGGKATEFRYLLPTAIEPF